MLEKRQQERLIAKLDRFAKVLELRMFEPVAAVEMTIFPTTESFTQVPEDDHFGPCSAGTKWGGAKSYCWFKGSYTVGENLAGTDLYLYPHIGGYEAMMWVDRLPRGIFTSKIIYNSHGNHYCNLLKQGATAGETIDIALEYYAHHQFPGTEPFEEQEQHFDYEFSGVDICVKNQLVADYYFDFLTVLQLYHIQEETSFIKGDLINKFVAIFEQLHLDPAIVTKAEFESRLEATHGILKEILVRKNSVTAPKARLIGHSHMDTAWLWTQGETLKKCARTYSNQMNLMDQYDEYRFLQSSAYHTEMIRRNYPELFEKIKERVLEGKYEPNGGVWVESDCNLPSGEYLARQFLWGQRYTKKHFNFVSDTFWLPDTFGYSAALPQIMKQSGIDYFLTTKIDWNDTNVFPFDSFNWEGIDSSEVLVHFNRTHIWPDVENLNRYVVSVENGLKEKSVTDKRFIAYGFGDGGGGPQFEMIEMARRAQDLEGVPQAKHQTVSQFMHELAADIQMPATYSGELYLELHRGTLTNKHQIKRNNRLAEIALHDLEYLTVAAGIRQGTKITGEAINPLTETLLVNQFHDILPGTCIQEAHEQSLTETTELIQKANQQIADLLRQEATATLTVSNTLSFERQDVIYLPFTGGYVADENISQQLVTNLKGDTLLAVAGVKQGAFSSTVLPMTGEPTVATSSFVYDGQFLETPYYRCRFDQKGYLAELYDKEANRELRDTQKLALNTFLVAEDISAAWDNWDIDADIQLKFEDVAELLESTVISEGSVEFRIRNRYRLTDRSTLSQDVIFYAYQKEIVFETIIDWQDDHRFLKTAFDTTIFTRTARQEIQFGHIQRPTTRNTAIEKAQFEVCNHKYSDLSETRYGVALLNDCKYGISVEGGSLHLSLHKGGNRPDPSGDKGQHYCRYAFLPHDGAFAANSVVQPAYEFNYLPKISEGAREQAPLWELDQANIIIETVKPLEDGGKGYLLRLYEAEGAQTIATLQLHTPWKRLALTNLLEEELAELTSETLTFSPFEIKNIKVEF